MLTQEQLREAGLKSVEDVGVGINVTAENGQHLFLTDEVIAQLHEAMERRGKQEYEVVVQPSAINRKEIIVSTIWAANMNSAVVEAEEAMDASSMGDLDFIVRLKNQGT